MKSRSTSILLAIVVVLLAANLVSPLLRPAHAQESKVCTGMSSTWDGREIHLFRVWSDGKVEERGEVGIWSDLILSLKGK